MTRWSRPPNTSVSLGVTSCNSLTSYNNRCTGHAVQNCHVMLYCLYRTGRLLLYSSQALHDCLYNTVSPSCTTPRSQHTRHVKHVINRGGYHSNRNRVEPEGGPAVHRHIFLGSHFKQLAAQVIGSMEGDKTQTQARD